MTNIMAEANLAHILDGVPDDTPLEELIAISVLTHIAMCVKDGQEPSATMLKILRHTNNLVVKAMAERAMRESGVTHTNIIGVKTIEAALLGAISNTHSGTVEECITALSIIMRQLSRGRPTGAGRPAPQPRSHIKPAGTLSKDEMEKKMREFMDAVKTKDSIDWEAIAKELFNDIKERSKDGR